MVLHEILWAFQQHVNGVSSAGSHVFDDDGGGTDIFPESVRLYNSHFSESIANLSFVHEFVEKIQRQQYESTNSFGLYKQAFCSGIKDALRSYNYLFLEVEQLILNDEDFSLVSLATKLEPIVAVSRTLKEAVNEIELKNVVGCQFLDVCETYRSLSVDHVQRAFQIIHKTCLKPFATQMNFWLLRAELYDPFDEFFIRSDDVETSIGVDTCSLAASSVSSLDALEFSKPVNFKIALEKLPSFLPYSTAKKILFIGESLLMCRKDPNNPSTLDESEREEILDQCGLNPFLVLNKMKTFEDADVLNVDSFGAFVSEIYEGVNQFAKTLATDVADVKGQMSTMRDLYFLGRGELFQEFIVRANDHLSRPARKVRIHTLKSLFEDAFYYVYLSNESHILDSVRFSLPGKDFVPEEAGTLDYLELDVSVRWPLASIFSHQVVHNFKKIFRFLMKLKRAQLTMSESWLELNAQKDKRTFGRLATLLNWLNAFVGMLQNYCSADVVEHEIQRLFHSIDESLTYTDIQDSVDNFQKTVVEQLFLNFGDAEDYFPTTVESSELTIFKSNIQSAQSRSISLDDLRTVRGTVVDMNVAVHKLFVDVFDCCRQFSCLAKNSIIAIDEAQVTLIENRSRTAIQSLFALSNTYDDCSYLHNLVFRLDFNNFFRNNFAVS